MENKYVLQKYADAAIAQSGTESEKNALKTQLQGEIQSYGRSYDDSSVSGAWYKLGNVDLSDAKIKAGIIEFVENERKLKGGNAGSDFEIPYAILLKYWGLAAKVGDEKKNASSSVTANTQKDEATLRMEYEAAEYRKIKAAEFMNMALKKAADEKAANDKKLKQQASAGNSPSNAVSTTGTSRAPVVSASSAPAAVAPSAPSAPSVPSVAPAKSPEKKDKGADKEKILATLEAWREAAKGADSLSNKEEIESHLKLLSASEATLAKVLTEFVSKYASGNDPRAKNDQEWVRSIFNEIAEYRRGEGKIMNKHCRNPIIAEGLLKSMLMGNGIDFPEPPNQAELLKKLDSKTKILISSLLDASIKKGKSFEEALGEALGNPTIKGAWNRVMEDGLGDYEKKMLESIKQLESKSLTQEQKKSLDQLKEIYGAKGWWNIKDDTKAKLVVGRDQILAVGLGVAGAALTATLLGAEVGIPMMIASTALVGGSLTTGASMLMEQKVYSPKEALVEGGINIGTFMVGGILFKVTRSAGVIAKIGATGAVGTEMAGNVGLGMSIDQIRANFQGVDVSLLDSLKNNLVWALLPLAVQGLGAARVKLANQTAGRLENANTRSAIGDTQGAEQILRETDANIKAAQAEQAATTNGNPKNQVTSENSTQTNNGANEVSVQPTVLKNTPGIDRLANRLKTTISKLEDGKEITIGDVKITKKGKDYLYVDTDTKTPVKFPDIDGVMKKMGSKFTNEHYLDFALKSELNTMISKTAGNEIQVGGKTYRVSKDGDGFKLEKQGADGGYRHISEAELTQLSDVEMNAILNSSLGKGASKYFDIAFKNPFSDTNPWFKKVKDIKVKDFFADGKTSKDYNWKGMKIPKYMYDWTVGNMVKELIKSGSLGTMGELSSLKKIEVLRTLYTGRSSGGNLWVHGHGKVLPTAWMPSAKIVTATVGITALELGYNGYSEMNSFEDVVNYTWKNQNEFVDNYFNYLYFGFLGTALKECSESLGLIKEGTIGVTNAIDYVRKSVGNDGSPNK